MLVNRIRSAIAGGDGGSAVVAVLVVMLVLSIGAMATAVIVTNTSGVVADTRSSTQSRAAADAGLSDATTLAKRSGSFCGAPSSGSLGSGSSYAVTTTCDTTARTVTFTSVGTSNGASTTARAVYHYTTGTTGHGADMVFYSDTTFTKEVVTSNGSNGLLSIVIPSGNFTCQVHIPANIIASGDVKTNGSCTIDGNVRSGMSVNMSNGSDLIKGNVTASATTSMALSGMVQGNIWVGGALAAPSGWTGHNYPGNITAGGNVDLTNGRITGTLTLPKANKVDYDGYRTITSPTASSDRISGGVVWKDTVAPPTKPTFDGWFDYSYKLADWRPYNGKTYNEIKLAASGNGTWTCNRFNANNPNTGNAAGWRELGALTTPTIIDATACSSLSSNNGSNPNVTLATDIVFVSKVYDLTSLTLKSTSGTTAKVWFITNDGLTTGAGAGKPNCSNGAGSIGVNHTDVAGVNAMIYTPCTINVQGNSKWTGAMYGGAFSYGGGMTFVGANIALPGMPSSATMPGAGESSAPALGALVSRQDVP